MSSSRGRRSTGKRERPSYRDIDSDASGSDLDLELDSSSDSDSDSGPKSVVDVMEIDDSEDDIYNEEEDDIQSKKKNSTKKTKKTTKKQKPTSTPKTSAKSKGKSSQKSKPKPKPKSKASTKKSDSNAQKPKGRKKPPVKAATAGDLGKIDALTEGQGYEREAKSLEELGLRDSIIEVEVVPANVVATRIEALVVKCVKSILTGTGFSYEIPNRSASNQIYIPELDRIALNKSGMSKRNFTSVNTVKKVTIMTRVLQLIHNILQRGIHITKRDLFYTDVKLFQDQKNSDAVLDDAACMVGVTRTCLNVIASEKGVVVGNLQFREAGDLIDCSRMGIGGKGVPPLTDTVTDITSTAKFILLVEKDAAFMRLSEDRFYQKFPCIILTAKGQPDVASRLFLRRLRNELNIPVLALMDSDPYGLKILSVYMSGSKNMSYDAASLTCPDIKWVGVRPSDLNRYNIPKECRLAMTESDIKTGEALLKEDFIQKNANWVKEIQLMLKTKEKAEIQALSTFGFKFLTETYLPEKIKRGDWI